MGSVVNIVVNVVIYDITESSARGNLGEYFAEYAILTVI